MNEIHQFPTDREKALSLALPSAIGVAKGLRIPNLDAEDRIGASNVLGSLPTGGQALEERAKTKLASTVKQALGDLGVQGDNISKTLKDRISTRPFFYDDVIKNNFAHMIRVYHEIRENNLHYVQALIPGLKGLKNPDRFVDALLPSPDSILNGTTAYIIFDAQAKPTITGFKGAMREYLEQLLNIVPPVRSRSTTAKQQQVGQLLQRFDFNRKNAAKAVENALMDAMSVGGDFASAYTRIANDPAKYAPGQPLNTDEEKMRHFTQQVQKAARTYKKPVTLRAAKPLFSFAQTDEAATRPFYELLVEEDAIFKISDADVEDQNFFLIPLTLPTFDKEPIGWDRRWMIATMKIIHEYWDMIYSKNREILLQDLLYLIATRTKELFNYDLDVVQMTILALLLQPEEPEPAPAPAPAREAEGDRRGARRAYSILPRNQQGRVPLKSIAKILQLERDERVAELEKEVAAAKKAEEEAEEKAEAATEAEKTVRKKSKKERDREKSIRVFEKRGEKLLDRYNSLDGKLTQEQLKELDALLDGPLGELEKIAEDYPEDLDEPFNLLREAENLMKTFIEGLPEGTKIVEEDENGNTDITADNLDEFLPDDNLDEYLPLDDDEIPRADPVSLGNTDYGYRANPPAEELGFITGEVIVGTNFVRDIGTGIRDFFGGRSKRLEQRIDEAMKLLIEELESKAQALGGNHIKDIRIQPLMYGGDYMITLIGHGVACKVPEKKEKKAVKKNPMPEVKTGRDFKQRTAAIDYAKVMAAKHNMRFFVWGGKYQDGTKVTRVSPDMPGNIPMNQVTMINPDGTREVVGKENPPFDTAESRKYKGMEIKKVEDGWKVVAYDKVLPTLEKAKSFISSKVKSSASPGSRCVRIIGGVQCKGMVVLTRSKNYCCEACKAKYKAV